MTQQIDQEIQDFLSKWKKGEHITSVEMGGIGWPYEMCIQVAAFKILEQLMWTKASRKHEDFTWEILNPTIDLVLPHVQELGLSGAQWGAAKTLAAAFYKFGPAEAIRQAPEVRHIKVSQHAGKAVTQ